MTAPAPRRRAQVRVIPLVLAATSLTVTAGCTAATGPGVSDPPTMRPMAAAGTGALPSVHPPQTDDEGGRDGHDGQDYDLPDMPVPVPSWDEESRADAGRAAEVAVAAYAADLDPDTWWGSLAPLLTPSAQTAYVGTDPSNVPVGALTGPPVVLTQTPSSFLVQVDVPTDVGPYGVLLARTGARQPWLVERFPPVSDAAAAP